MQGHNTCAQPPTHQTQKVVYREPVTGTRSPGIVHRQSAKLATKPLKLRPYGAIQICLCLLLLLLLLLPAPKPTPNPTHTPT